MTTETGACLWCGDPFVPNKLGEKRRYCSIACRTDAGHWREYLPRWLARLEELEQVTSKHRRGERSYLANELSDLRRWIAAGPVGTPSALPPAPPGLCPVCRKPTGGRRVYCSAGCRLEGQALSGLTRRA